MLPPVVNGDSSLCGIGTLAPRKCFPKASRDPLCLRSSIPSLPGCVAAGETDRSQILKNVRNAIRGRFPLYNLGFGHDLDFSFLEVMSIENNGWAQRIYEDHDATQQLQVSPTPPAHHHHYAMGFGWPFAY